MKNRVVYGVLLIVLMVFCVLLSRTTRVLFIAAAGIMCAWEYSHQMEKLNMRCSLCVMVFYLAAQAALVLMNAGIGAYSACFTASVYLAMLSGILRKEVRGNGALDTAAGLAYPCLQFGVVMAISVCSLWLETIALGCICTWACDTGALLGGSRFGKHKLAPAISPNKTVEGAVIGALSSVLGGALVWCLGVLCRSVPHLGTLYRQLPPALCILTGLAASTMGQLGDLAESLIKRMIGVKDFSDLIPGHGGIFDRADSLLFSVPTAYFCLRLAETLHSIP